MHVYYCMYIYTFHTTLAISWCQTQFKEIYNCNLIINSKRPVTHHKGWPTVVMQLRSNFQSSPRLAKEPRTRSHLRIETQTNRRGKNGANFGWVFFFFFFNIYLRHRYMNHKIRISWTINSKIEIFSPKSSWNIQESLWLEGSMSRTWIFFFFPFLTKISFQINIKAFT